jgi:hypothetical protein
MQRQITAGIIVVIIALTAIATTSQPIQSQIERGNDPVGGDIVQSQIEERGNEPVGGDIVEQQREFGIPDKLTGLRDLKAAAPPAITGDNVYVAWWTNDTANNNNEVMFRASTDGGQTFGDKINLSNTTDADSTRVEIDSDADNVVVTWWETNQTDDTPVMRVSNDNGEIFGPLLRLATNGTIGETAEEG